MNPPLFRYRCRGCGAHFWDNYPGYPEGTEFQYGPCCRGFKWVDADKIKSVWIASIHYRAVREERAKAEALFRKCQADPDFERRLIEERRRSKPAS